MGLFDVFTVVKSLAKAMGPGDKITTYLKDQQAAGAVLSPKLRNAIAMYDLMKTNPPDDIGKEFSSFADANWYYLDICSEIEANPGLLPESLADAFETFKSCVKTAMEAGDRTFARECAKWEKKNGRKYQPKPRPNLIGEPLE